MREMSMGEKVRRSLVGKYGANSRAWKGDGAGYVAIHLWLSKHYAKGDRCEECGTKEFSRLEWSNISGEYKRKRSDYKVSCPSCHRKNDYKKSKTHCPQGHEYSRDNTHINIRGHRQCRLCAADNNRRYRNAKSNNKV